MKIDQLQTPCYVIDEKKMRENLEILKKVQEDTGCKILLAQKAFSGFALYPMIGKYLAGTTASGLFEARLGYEEMGKENHVFSPAYRTEDIEELDRICDHIIFNSTAQLKKFKEVCTGASLGLRINPECSTQGDHAIYDPCAPGSRLGVTRENFDVECLKWIDGLHFHTLCEQNADDLEKTLQAVEEKFGEFLSEVSWLNMGGGHHITIEDYDVKLLEKCIQHMKETYDLDIYLEPGEAVALNAGYLVTEVMDILQVIVIVLIGHFIWIALLYILAGIYSRENPLKVVKHYGPAYLTAIGTMSSAATLPVALQCAHRAKPLRKDLVDFGIPLFANIHLCGSVLTEVFFCMAISKILYGAVPAPGAMVLFCVLLGIFAIGAPGVPGGTVMASLGIITGILKFGDSATALMLTIFALQDSFGTACNVTGDGALTLILTGYARYHNIREQKLQ